MKPYPLNEPNQARRAEICGQNLRRKPSGDITRTLRRLELMTKAGRDREAKDGLNRLREQHGSVEDVHGLYPWKKRIAALEAAIARSLVP